MSTETLRCGCPNCDTSLSVAVDGSLEEFATPVTQPRERLTGTDVDCDRCELEFEVFFYGGAR